MGNTIILSSIKSRILAVVPTARIMLFGSRANGTPTDESDWDILVLTSQPVTPSIKKNIHNAVFPFSVQLGAFINTLIVQEDDWNTNPSYYSLHQTIDKGLLYL